MPGTTDQVDVNVNVTEKPTGNIMLGAGFSSSEGLILSGSISQHNLFGSGNHLSAQINSGNINKVYSLSYTDPYFTDDGVSRGFDVYKRKLTRRVLIRFDLFDLDPRRRRALRCPAEREGQRQSRTVALEKTDISLTDSCIGAA